MKIHEKILFVDDEESVRQAMKRFLRNKYTILLAKNGHEAIDILQNDASIAVIISDYSMGGMNGVELFEKMSESAMETIRILLTGRTDLDIAIDAINSGHLFRFLTKPVNEITLLTSIDLALDQYRLVRSERELLKNTLKGSIQVLCELLAATEKTAFSSGSRIRLIVKHIAKNLEIEKVWPLEIAAMLSQVGCVIAGSDILKKVYDGAELSESEQKLYLSHPKFGAKMINRIPRLEQVSEIIRLQKNLLHGFEGRTQINQTTLLFAQILKIAHDYDLLTQQGSSKESVIEYMKTKENEYRSDILQALEQETASFSQEQVLSLMFHEIVPGMIADEDILAKNGTMVIAKGQEITWPAIRGITNYLEHIGIREPIRVRSATY